ncbi:MAG: Dabb family protein [Planctomycetes bacterium]|nr:Dabb family protein [Planctomycetota bacterium]
MRRAPLALLTLLVLLAGLPMAACRTAPAAPGDVDHLVLLWLKQPHDERALRRLEQDGRAFVGRIPGLTHVSLGRAWIDDEALQDSPYDVAFAMNFVDLAALQAYEQHPQHPAAVTELLQPHADRMRACTVLLR